MQQNSKDPFGIISHFTMINSTGLSGGETTEYAKIPGILKKDWPTARDTRTCEIIVNARTCEIIVNARTCEITVNARTCEITVDARTCEITVVAVEAAATPPDMKVSIVL